jgi:hypothetical protein
MFDHRSGMETLVRVVDFDMRNAAHVPLIVSGRRAHGPPGQLALSGA